MVSLLGGGGRQQVKQGSGKRGPMLGGAVAHNSVASFSLTELGFGRDSVQTALFPAAEPDPLLSGGSGYRVSPNSAFVCRPLLVLFSVRPLSSTSRGSSIELASPTDAPSGEEYIVDGKLCGKDCMSTKAPQAYGITSLEALLP